jgi:hypothetical protein
MTTSLVGEDVRPSVTPTECACSLGRFSDESDKEHKEDVIGWERTCLMGVGRSTLGHDGDV